MNIEAMRASVAIGAAAALLSGCAVRSSGVVGAGADTYLVAIEGRSSSTYGDLKARALREATAHCSAQARALKIVSEVTNAYIPFVRNPDVQITFQCVPGGNSAPKPAAAG